MEYLTAEEVDGASGASLLLAQDWRPGGLICSRRRTRNEAYLLTVSYWQGQVGSLSMLEMSFNLTREQCLALLGEVPS